jgi:methyl-accepting chemotaxis protein
MGANTAVTFTMLQLLAGIATMLVGLWAIGFFLFGGVRDDIKTIRSNLQDAQKDSVTRTDNLNKNLSDQIRNLNKTYGDLKIEFVKLGGQFELTNKSVDSLTSGFIATNKSIEYLSSRLGTTSRLVESLAVGLSATNKSMDELSARLGTTSRSVESLAVGLGATNKSMDELSSRLGTTSRSVESLAVGLGATNKSMDELSSRLDKFQAAFVSASTQDFDPRRLAPLIDALKKLGIDEQRIIIVPLVPTLPQVS